MDTETSSYLDYLPAIFRQEPFAGRFLLAFETVLSGTSTRPDPPGLETTIGSIADYFDPVTAPDGFLPWLAGWVSLTLRADWDTDTQRKFIAQIVPLYRLRGTGEGLRQMLNLYTRLPVDVFDPVEKVDFFFQVQITLPAADGPLMRTTQQIARAIIDQEKPAHTFYALRIAVPMMRLVSEELIEQGASPLILGDNTILGTYIPKTQKEG
jgi:phage tail-like protein